MRKLVLCGAIEAWTLPTPFLALHIVVVAVTLPEGDVAVVETFGRGERFRKVLGPWVSPVFQSPEQAVAVFVFDVIIGYQL